MISSGSRIAAKAAISIAMTESREEEIKMKEYFIEKGIKVAAVDYGGEFNGSVSKIIERAVVAAKRENIIKDTHGEEGAIAGATHEAIENILPNAFGLNVGGKIGIARYKGHISVCIFFGVGLVHLDDISIGFAHRAVN